MPAARPSSFRRTALGCTAVAVLAGGLLTAAPAMASGSASTFDDLNAALADTTSSPDQVSVGASISAPGGVLTVPSGQTAVLDLGSYDVHVQRVVVGGASGGAQLTLTGSGSLVVDDSSESSTTAATVSVDDGSTMIVADHAHLQVTGAGGQSQGAGIGGDADRSAGTVVFDQNSSTQVVHSGQGAAIGGGYYGTDGTITVQKNAAVTATQNGDGAAVGGGSDSTTDGSITVLGTSSLQATETGRGAAIGGGYKGPGGTIAIGEYSTVTATGTGGGEAGIGDGELAVSGGAVTINGYSTVTATGGALGGHGGAAIGSGWNAYGNGSVTIGGNSTVSATGTAGPGIGGEGGRYSTAVSIGDAAKVIAAGGGAGAGIGGGDDPSDTRYTSTGAALTVSGSADVTVSAANGVSAVGPGSGTAFGSVSNSSVLRLGGGQRIVVPSGSSFANSGTIVNGGTLTTSGSGTIDNEGVVLNSGTVSGTVTGYAYALSYNPGTGRVTAGGNGSVYASTLQKAQVGVAAAQPATSGTFVGWNTASDGTGTYLSASTDLSSIASTSTGSPVTVPLYAIYQLNPVLGGGSLPTGYAHRAYSGSVAATAGTGPLTYSETGSFPAGLKLDGATGAITGTPTTSGTYRFTVRVANHLSSTTRGYTISIGKPLAASFSLTVKAKHAFGLKVWNLLSSEKVRLVMTGAGKGTWNGTAKKGSYTLAFKHGLSKKGKYTVTVTARSTGRSAVFHITVK